MGTRLPKLGVHVNYLSCANCGFLFTSDFDEWSHKEFKNFIYNDRYWIVDPDYLWVRPKSNARRIESLVDPEVCKSLLDYGGGNGVLAQGLRRQGFQATTYDPFNPEYSIKPDAKFDLVTCFETLEHVPEPKSVIRDLANFVNDNGVIIFSTFLRRVGSADDGIQWWYVGPRNGHVSIFSEDALHRAWNEVGFDVGSATQYVHMAWRKNAGCLTDTLKAYFHIPTAHGRPSLN